MIFCSNLRFEIRKQTKLESSFIVCFIVVVVCFVVVLDLIVFLLVVVVIFFVLLIVVAVVLPQRRSPSLSLTSQPGPYSISVRDGRRLPRQAIFCRRRRLLLLPGFVNPAPERLAADDLKQTKMERINNVSAKTAASTDGESQRRSGQNDSEEEGEDETESSSPGAPSPAPPSPSPPSTYDDDDKSDDRDDAAFKSTSSSTDSDDELEYDCQRSLEQQLEQFRTQWRLEIEGDDAENLTSRNDALQKEKQKEQEALFLYRQGVREEKRGNMYSAVMMYRRAMQLVPEIESRVPELKQLQHAQRRRRRRTSSESQGGSTSEQDAAADASEQTRLVEVPTIEEEGDREKAPSISESDDLANKEEMKVVLDPSAYLEENEGVDEVIPEGVSLVQHLTNKRLASNDAADKKCCVPEKAIEDGSKHFSHLPPEIMLYILQWVISEDCDVRSLERFSAVCRGFFLLGRDGDLWRMLCQKMWTMDCLRPKILGYDSWRHMFLRRPHPIFDGIYIAKTSYIRQGEQTFGSTYCHWQLVEYFRYVRLFSDGFMLMLTTCDDPITTIPKIKSRHSKYPGLMTGYYRTMDCNDGKERLTAQLTRAAPAPVGPSRRPPGGRGNKGANAGQEGTQTFHLELEMRVTGKRRVHSCLQWRAYAVHTTHRVTGDTSVSPFELKPNNYPDLYFSRVKSYSSVALKPLRLLSGKGSSGLCGAREG